MPQGLLVPQGPLGSLGLLGLLRLLIRNMLPAATHLLASWATPGGAARDGQEPAATVPLQRHHRGAGLRAEPAAGHARPAKPGLAG